jgi:hypothetical protein
VGEHPGEVDPTGGHQVEVVLDAVAALRSCLPDDGSVSVEAVPTKYPQGAGEMLIKKYGWKIGDTIPLQSQIFPNQEGSKNWSFKLVGVMSSKDGRAFQSGMIILHWKKFDETTPYNRGQAGWYVTRVKDVNPSVARARVSSRARSGRKLKWSAVSFAPSTPA